MLPLVSERVADHTQRGHTASAQGTLRHRRHPTSSGWSGDTQVLARTSCEGAGTHRISHTGRSHTAGTHRFGTGTPRGGHTGSIPRKAPLHGSFCGHTVGTHYSLFRGRRVPRATWTHPCHGDTSVLAPCSVPGRRLSLSMRSSDRRLLVFCSVPSLAPVLIFKKRHFSSLST